MKPYTSFFLILVLFGVMTSGCRVTSSGEGQKNTNKTPIQIQVSIYKNYDDGLDLKIQLLNTPTVKGNWTIHYCGTEKVQKDKGASIIYSIAYEECTIPIGHEDDKNHSNIYINFSGATNEEKITVDKIYILDLEEVDKVPLERQTPDTRWVMLQTFIKTGYLFGASVHIGSTREEIIDFFGKPKSPDNPNILDYDDVQFNMYGDKVGEIKIINTKEFPIDLPNNDKDDIIRVFGNPDETYAEDGIYYSKYDLGKSTATFAWSQKESKLISVEVIQD